MSQNKIKIIYKWQPYNKINGSLFYCFEYLITLLLLDKNVQLYIYNIKDIEEQKLVIKAFKDKYDESFIGALNSINFYNTMLDVYQNNKIEDKYVFLDIYSYNDIGSMLNLNKKFAYINNNYEYSNKHRLKEVRNTTFFGFYNYQKHPNVIKSKLKIGLTYQKCFNMGNKTYISAPEQGYKIDHKDHYIYKDILKIQNDLFNDIDKLIYIHNGLDTNNRIIVEAFYHGKDVEIVEQSDIVDSTHHRYSLCMTNNIDQLILNEKDLMIQHIIGNIDANKRD